MVPGLRVEFTVVRERARRDALLRRATRATPASPALVLCPDASVARAIERQLAEAGGAFASVLDWEQLLDALVLAGTPVVGRAQSLDDLAEEHAVRHAVVAVRAAGTRLL